MTLQAQRHIYTEEQSFEFLLHLPRGGLCLYVLALFKVVPCRDKHPTADQALVVALVSLTDSDVPVRSGVAFEFRNLFRVSLRLSAVDKQLC